MEVKVLLDSINPYTGVRLTTLHCVYPQFIHQQVLTHRMFSRNSSSLRAISFNRVSEEFEIVYPIWTNEKKGMRGSPLEDFTKTILADSYVNGMYQDVLNWAKKLNDLGIHHQDINNYLRPFQNIHTVITATDWDNFFNQRLAEATKPDMQALAVAMKDALDNSEPENRYSHVPMIDEETFFDNSFSYDQLNLISTARLARISYFKWTDDPYKDLELAYKLMSNGHASPFEHVAFAQQNNEYYANFKSWRQLRHVLKV